LEKNTISFRKIKNIHLLKLLSPLVSHLKPRASSFLPTLVETIIAGEPWAGSI